MSVPVSPTPTPERLEVDPLVPRVLHSVAAKMKAKADAELAKAQRHHAIAMQVVEQTEASAIRAERLIAANGAQS